VGPISFGERHGGRGVVGMEDTMVGRGHPQEKTLKTAAGAGLSQVMREEQSAKDDQASDGLAGALLRTNGKSRGGRVKKRKEAQGRWNRRVTFGDAAKKRPKRRRLPSKGGEKLGGKGPEPEKRRLQENRRQCQGNQHTRSSPGLSKLEGTHRGGEVGEKRGRPAGRRRG